MHNNSMLNGANKFAEPALGCYSITIAGHILSPTRGKPSITQKYYDIINSQEDEAKIDC